MKKIKQLKDKQGKVFFEIGIHDKGYIYQNWSGKIDEEKVKLGVETTLGVIKNTDIPFMVNDNSELSGNWTSSNDWIESYFIPLAYENGLRYIAHILSPYFITKFSSIDLETRDLKVIFKTFSSLQEAEEWLATKATDLQQK